MKTSRARIVTIGDEILIGQIVDTNSAWMASELNLLGIKVDTIESISDTNDAIVKALESQGEDLLLLTGGLGPTKDDITKRTLTDYFKTELVRDHAVESRIREAFEKRGFELKESNLLQADMPKSAVVLSNEMGTASGMMFQQEERFIVSMPGVPYEMKHIFSERLVPIIEEKLVRPCIHHKTIMTAGVGESVIAEWISEIENGLPAHIKLAYLPRPGKVRLRLSATGESKETLEREVDDISNHIIEKLGVHHYGYNEQSLSAAVGERLRQIEATLSTAESCTGGSLASKITEVAGSSIYYLGSTISYSYASKTQILKVPAELIATHGAVSAECVKAMNVGNIKLTSADYSIAISGIAGPGGGTEEKPVGTVWVDLLSKEGHYTKKLQLGSDRKLNIERTCVAAFFMLWKTLNA